MARDRKFLEEVRYHHLRLQLVMRAAREVLTCRATHVATVPPHSALLVPLADLNRELAEHFALEEKNGYFQEVEAVAPRFARLLEQLQLEHVSLLQRARELLQLAGESVTAPPGWDRVAAGMSELLHRIEVHEREENELIQGAFSSDLGGSG